MIRRVVPPGNDLAGDKGTVSGRRLIACRMSLLIALSVLVSLSGAAIIANSYLHTRSLVTQLAHRVFDEVLRRAVEQTRARMDPAMPVLAFLERGRYEGLMPEDQLR